MSSFALRVRRSLPAAAPGGTLPVAAPARAATVVSVAVAVLALGVQVLVPGGWGGAAWMPLVAGLLVGLPHGAVDHLVPGFRLGRRPVVLAAFALGYACLAALGWALFHAAPGVALVVFVLVSAWHFGTGETAFADLRAGRPVRRHPAVAAVLGSVVLLIPLARAASSARGRSLLAGLVPGFSGMLPGRLPVVVVAVATAVAVLLITLRVLRRRPREALEPALLLAVALVMSPLAAFGVYFGGWHAVRHTARLLAEDPANDAALTAGRLGRPLARFAVLAAAPTAAVLAVLGLLWSTAGGWRGFVVADLPLLAALTLPHVLVVAWLDRAEGAVGEPQAGSRRIGTCGMPSST